MKRIKVLALLLCVLLFASGCNFSEKNEPEKQEPINEEKQQSVALYNGISLDEKDRHTNIFEGENNIREQILTKYETGYHLYSNQALIQESFGKVEQRGLDYAWQVGFPDKIEYEIALSQSYDPYPRPITFMTSNYPKEFEDSGEVIQKINNQFDVDVKVQELSQADLDGDGHEEFLAFVVDANKSFFAKCLVDSDFEIVSYFTVFQEDHQNFDLLVQIFSLLSAGEIIDINDDNVLEIVVQLPIYEGFSFEVLTYSNGHFSGDPIIKTTLQP